MSSLRAAVKRLRPSIRHDVNSLLAALAANRVARRAINIAYRWAPYRRKAWLYWRLSKIFRDSDRGGAGATWTVGFAGREVRTPLRPGRYWLDWDYAMSILGHEWKIKQTYDDLVGLRPAPDLFVDVGANLGSHSLLFLAHGIPAISVEPNPTCHPYIDEVCALNGLAPEIAPVALGDEPGSVELSFPESETWLGHVGPAAADELAGHADVVTQQVEQTTLDSLLADRRAERAVLKIDVEGNEKIVLDGARETLRRLRPVIIFESFVPAREQTWALLDELGYRIERLPWRPGAAADGLARGAFVSSPDFDFVALPAERF